MTRKNAIIKETTGNVLMILLGFAIYFIQPGLLRTTLLICLVLTALASFLEGVSRIVANADRIKRMKEKQIKVEEELTATKLSLYNANQSKSPAASMPSLPSLTTDDLSGDSNKIEEFLTSVYPEHNLPNPYLAYFRHVKEMDKAESYLRKFNEVLVSPIHQSLRGTPLPLSEEDKQFLLKQMLQYALVMMDFIDTYHYTVNNTPGQLLSIQAAVGEITSEEAFKKAVQATEFPDETPQYIRAIKALLESMELDDGDILYAGYKV